MKKILIVLILLSTGCTTSCAKEKLQSVKSPNGKYIVNTYRVNCHATIAFLVEGELCDFNNNCKQIYNGYEEEDSLVYWIDDKTIFINNKIFNPFKEKYNWKNDDNYFEKRYEKDI